MKANGFVDYALSSGPGVVDANKVTTSMLVKEVSNGGGNTVNARGVVDGSGSDADGDNFGARALIPPHRTPRAPRDGIVPEQMPACVHRALLWDGRWHRPGQPKRPK